MRYGFAIRFGTAAAALFYCGSAAARMAASGAPEAPAVATWFDALGQPYGGCGVPQDVLETQDFVALNVYATPGEYARSPARPLTGADLADLGAFDNGRNCGRWVRVTLGPLCTGINDGAPGQPFCRGTGAAWVDDAYSGGTLDFIVADSCGDGNAWCRDNPRHLDLSRPSLDRFRKDGALLTGMVPDHWNNRAIAWEYVPAPDYQGDVRLWFLKGTQKWWPAIAVTRLPNGIHGVEQWVDGAWIAAGRYGDMGQAFLLKPAEAFRIRLIDAADKPVFGGRVYAFGPPASCGATCEAAATPIAYQVEGAEALAEHGGPGTFRIVPSAGGLRVDGSGSLPAGTQIEVRDVRGRLAWRSPLAAQADAFVPLPTLAPGLYRVLIRSAGGPARDAGAFALP